MLIADYSYTNMLSNHHYIRSAIGNLLLVRNGHCIPIPGYGLLRVTLGYSRARIGGYSGLDISGCLPWAPVGLGVELRISERISLLRRV